MLGLTAAAAVAAFLAPSSAQRSNDASKASPRRVAPASLTGVASVIDGDTIEIHGQRVRFNGIDAPESRQLCRDANGAEYPCGRRSAEALDTFLAASRPLECTFVTWDRYHRFVGDCRRADGAGVAAWMVEHGQALDWPHYSQGAYAGQQAQAQASKIGLWAGTFQAPWEWRAAHADGAAPSSRPLGISAVSWSRRAAILASRGERASRSVPATTPTGTCKTAHGAENSIATRMGSHAKHSAS